MPGSMRAGDGANIRCLAHVEATAMGDLRDATYEALSGAVADLHKLVSTSCKMQRLPTLRERSIIDRENDQAG